MVFRYNINLSTIELVLHKTSKWATIFKNFVLYYKIVRGVARISKKGGGEGANFSINL